MVSRSALESVLAKSLTRLKCGSMADSKSRRPAGVSEIKAERASTGSTVLATSGSSVYSMRVTMMEVVEGDTPMRTESSTKGTGSLMS